MSEMHEKCAVVGVFDPEAATLAAAGIRRLDHRGPDSTGLAGIAETGESRVIHLPGRAREALTDAHVNELGRIGMVAAVAHARYATSGGADVFHPIKAGTGRQQIFYVENGNASHLTRLEADLARRGIPTAHLNDSQMKTAALGDRRRRGASVVEAIADAYPKFVGAHSSIVAGHGLDDEPLLAAFRDQCGIRPLIWGRTPSGGYMFVSETVGLDAAGATYGGEVNPGELMTVSRNGVARYQLAASNPKFDPFEIIYFSNKDSLFKGQRIGDIREALGRKLAEEYGCPTNSDIVVGVPNSAKTYAQGFAYATGISYEQDVLRKHKDERTFLGKTREEQAQLRNIIYDFNGTEVAGRRASVVDDSLLRNNTAPHITGMFFDAGATEVDLYIGSPPIRWPNYYGINTPEQHHLVASRMSMEDLRDTIGCRRLGYLSLEGMLQTFYDMTGEPSGNFDLSCFNGDYDHTPIGKRDISVPQHTGYSA